MITIEQVAEKVGVAPSTLSTWEGLARIRPEFRRAWMRRPWVRYYSPVQVLQFQAIAELRDRGLPLSEAIAQSDELVVEWWRLTVRAAKHRLGRTCGMCHSTE